MSIIFTVVSSGGSDSVIWAGVPAYSGSMCFSSAERYLTLSFASFAASVIALSRARHRRSARDFAAASVPTTARHSRPRSCSVIELNFAIRARHSSSSVAGPDSSVAAARLSSSSASSTSTFPHHESMRRSK